MTFMLPDGRALDDATAQDIPEAIAGVFDDLAKRFQRLDAEDAEGLEIEMVRAAGLMRAWARYGRWYTKDDLRGVARHAIWLDASEADRMQNFVFYESADRAVKEWLAR